MTYEAAIDYISSLAPRGWRLGLDRMAEFVRRCGLENKLGEPGGPQFIHVAGTNGKGSVTAFLQSLLVEQGYRAGAFFSPYVYDPRERVQFGREMIPKERLAEITAELIPIAESLSDTEFGGITEFEFKTALGFAFWAQEKAEWVALEVGLGGRLDATNVVSPKACVIVSIGLDHTNVLGGSIPEIAGEKAGIVKPDVPVIVGQMPHAALEKILDAAAQCNAPIWRFGREIGLVETAKGYIVETPNRRFQNLWPGIVGAKQPHNMALAIAALEAAGALKDGDPIEKGVNRASIPGRFEKRSMNGHDVVLDGAHNPDAAVALKENLDRYYPGRRILLVTGMVAGHDPLHFFEKFAERVHAYYVAPIDFHRSVPAPELAEAIATFSPRVETFRSAKEAFQKALADAEEGDVVLVAGSFYLVGEIGE